MIDMKEIESFYPERMRHLKRNLLREYMQYKILEIIFESPSGNSLCFTGGTAIHILHSSTRFSEDLDFDNRGLAREEFEQLTAHIGKELSLQGFEVETRSIFRSAFVSHIKISRLLYESGLSPHAEEKMIIHMDTESQDFAYRPENPVINKFDVFQMILAVPATILLSQKICAIFTRKRPMGRDFYDAVFLMSKTGPDWEYLRTKLHISDAADLRHRLIARCQGLNFMQLAKDVEPFLFRGEDSKKVLHFSEYIAGFEFRE